MLNSLELKNLKSELDGLNFHDSRILSVVFDEYRSCEVKLDYYNWECNQENPNNWVRKTLIIHFNFLAVFQWSAPNFVDESATISGATFDIGIPELLEAETGKKAEFHDYQSPIFDADNYLSIYFILNNCDLENDEVEGYLHLIGSDVKIWWF